MTTVPTTSIASPNYSEEALKARTEAFIAKGGAWDKFDDAAMELIRLVDYNYYALDGYEGAPEDRYDAVSVYREDIWGHTHVASPRYISHRPELSVEQAWDVVKGAGGLGNEFGNGPVLPIDTFLIKKLGVFEDGVRQVVGGFDDASQLSKDTKLAAVMGIPIDAQGKRVETKRQAFTRCANEIEAWTKANAQVIPQIDQQRIHKELGDYRSAYAAVLDYVDYVKGYLAKENPRSNMDIAAATGRDRVR